MENVKENIIRAASEKMRLAGIRSVSIDDICRELGISKKTFYVYFETKDVLIDELLRQREIHLRQDILRQMKGKAVAELALNFQKLMRGQMDVRQVPPLLYDLKKYYPQQLHDHLERLKMLNCDITAHFLRQGIAENLFRANLDVPATSRVLADLHQVMVDKMTAGKPEPNFMADSKMAIDIFFRGLLSEEGRRKLKVES